MRDALSIKLSVALVLLLVLILAACGGGRSANRSVLPGISGGGSAVSTDRGFAFTEADIPNLDPQIQELLAHPGWSGPPSPVPPVSGAPMPPPYSVEDSLSLLRELVDETEQLARSEEPVVPVRGTSYQQIPPPPDYFPEVGEYDPLDYVPPGPPPFGLDADENGYEDLFEMADQFGITTFASFVKHGLTIQNQFNRGTMTAGNAVSAVYQKARGPGSAAPNIELVYREAESGILSNPYRLEGPTHQLFNLLTRLRKISDPTPMLWYAVVIAPSSEYQDNGGLYWESTGCPNETFGGIQAFAYDPVKLPLLQADTMNWDENGSLVGSLFCKLESSEHDLIQELIDLQNSTGQPSAAFPVMGMILQRWIDDRFSPFQEPWEGRLGWPLGLPVINRSGRVITGPLGQYYQYYQYFEKGFMWWNDYIDPNTPDELYIYMYSEDCTLETGGDYEQDPMVVRYGTGGPLGMAVTAWPLLANVGDPIYYHAFPYGGPAGNVNAFLDDFFVWNFRDGNYYLGDGTDTLQTHEYYTEAKYVTRVMLVLDVDGDGNADGATPEYVYFADAPEVEIGHLGEPGGGGGGGEPTILIVQDNTAPSGSDSLTHVQAVQADLDAIGLEDGYDTVTTAQITSASDMEDYLCVIWCPPKSTATNNDWYDEQINASERAIIMSYVQGGGNLILPTTSLMNAFAGQPTWHEFMDAYWNSAYTSGQSYNTVAAPLQSGPGGAISTINRQMVFQSLGYTLGMSNVTDLLLYSSSATGKARDHVPSGAGGKMVSIATNWHLFTTTSPAGPGRAGLLWNLLNWIDPEILIIEPGGPGGDTIVPYEGPVDIADIYGWIYDKEGGDMSGGDTLDINVAGGALQANFECVARANTGIDLVYEWEFEPSTGFGIWTRYTSHTYIGAIDVDGDSDTFFDPDDWFDVTCRVYDSSFTYGTAPPDARDIDYFPMRVSGGVVSVWIDDNGTTFSNPYELDGSGNLNCTLHYSVGGGDGVFDSVWVDYDYDFMSFNNMVEVTPTPGPGNKTYNLTIPSAEAGHDYYVAIRVTDNDAPNVTDTYAWMTPVYAGGSILVVSDNGSSNASAITTDLAALGAGYSQVNSSSISGAGDLSGYALVIWCPGYNYTSDISTTEAGWMHTYITGSSHGNVLIPSSYQYMIDYGYVYNDLIYDMGSSYGYWYSWYQGTWPCYGNDPWGNAYVAGTGPGGTIDYMYSSYYPDTTDFYYGSLRTGSRMFFSEYGYEGSYIEGGAYDNYSGTNNGGIGAWVGGDWNFFDSSSPTTPGRKGCLWNIIEYIDSSLI